jgi:hypothetical protein
VAKRYTEDVEEEDRERGDVEASCDCCMDRHEECSSDNW